MKLAEIAQTAPRLYKGHRVRFFSLSTALIIAILSLSCPAAAQHDEEMRTLIDLARKLRDSMDYKGTPLHKAAEDGSFAEVRRLANEGANIEAKDSYGDTPLHRAAYNGREDVAAFLISNGADVNAKGLGDYAPLHWAAGRNHMSIAELLISKGADVNAQDGLLGNTALHLAAGAGYDKMVTMLIDKAADMRGQNFLGETPVEIARTKGQAAVVQLLLAKDSRLGNTRITTATELGNIFGPARAALVQFKSSPLPDLIRFAQERLSERGHEPGPIDGLYGSRTRQAIKSYQSSIGLIETGELDILTFNLLFQDASYQSSPVLSREDAVRFARECFHWTENNGIDLVPEEPAVITLLASADGVQRCHVSNQRFKMPISNGCFAMFQSEIRVVVWQFGKPIAESDLVAFSVGPRSTVNVSFVLGEFNAECIPHDNSGIPESDAIVAIGRLNFDSLFSSGSSREALMHE